MMVSVDLAIRKSEIRLVINKQNLYILDKSVEAWGEVWLS